MKYVWDIVLTMLIITVYEAFAKPAIIKWAQRTTRKYLPQLINKLDPVMPKLIAELSSEELERKIFDEALGLGATEEEAKILVPEFDKQFSPVKAARVAQPDQFQKKGEQ